MSSDEFRVTQHVMKTIKDEMPAIVRSMVSMFWFFHCTVSAFELRVFLWYSLIRLIIHDYTVITRSNLPRYLTRWRLPWLWPVSPLLRPGAYIFHKLVSTVCNFMLVLWKKYLWQNSPNPSVVNLGFALTYIRSNLLELGYWPMNDLSGK